MKTGEICFGENCFEVEIAKTIFEKIRGLSGRKSLAENHGMLFEFSISSIYPFTMQNTLIPLDIIWIDKNKKIVDIRENNQPCRGFFCPPIIPKKLSKYVLELNAGEAKKANLEIGDVATLSFLESLSSHL